MSQDFLTVLNVSVMASLEKKKFHFTRCILLQLNTMQTLVSPSCRSPEKKNQIGAGEGGSSRTVIFLLPYSVISMADLTD